MQGLHLTADLTGCRCATQWLVDAPALGAACVARAEAAGLQVVGKLCHAFPPVAEGTGKAGGVTVAVLLAESHLCAHTWPERSAVTLDVYVCNIGADHSAQARALLAALEDLFQPTRVERHALQRGGSDARVAIP
jgi:S-adenosylmethionine decarboxylase